MKRIKAKQLILLTILVLAIVTGGLFSFTKNNQKEIEKLDVHYSEIDIRYNEKEFSKEDLYWIKKMDAPIRTYPIEVKDFINQNNYVPGYYFIQLEDNEKQLLAERETNNSYQERENKQKKLGGDQNKEIIKFIKTLNKKYEIWSIDRPEIKQHTPEKTGIYWNNYYRIKLVKRDSGEYGSNDIAIKELESFPIKNTISKNGIYMLQNRDADPDDPILSSTDWYLEKVKAGPAWEAIKNIEGSMPEPGSASTVVGVVDDGGIQTLSHPDLQQNMIASPAMSTIPGSNHYHGTHVAGITSADTNNGKGVPAIAYNFSKVAVGGADFNNQYTVGQNLKTQSDRAISKGAIAINRSRGCIETNQEAESQRGNRINQRSNTLFVTAAGNDSLNPDTDNAYTNRCISPSAIGKGPGQRKSSPAGVDANNIIVVAASSYNDQKAGFSNYGSFIDVTAPGEGIMSTVNRCLQTAGSCPQNQYQSRPGTSMAAPTVNSLIGLLAGTPKGQQLSNNEIIQIIQNTADTVSREGGAGRINVCAAVAAIGYPCLDYDTPGCDIGTTQECTPYPDQYKGVCAEAGTQTCEDPDGDGQAGERGECIPNIQPGDQEENDSADTCTDGLDNDCDGFVDCADYPDCTTGANNIQCESEESICNDGGDNDGDGDSDCDDQDCDGALVTGDDFDDYYCEYEQELSCSDGADNDGDGNSDCDDQEDCGVIVEIDRSDNGGEICGTDNNQITLTATGLSTTGVTSIVREPTGQTEREIDIEVTETVTYTATVVNLNGCTGTQSITIEYRDPTPEICDTDYDEDCDGEPKCDDPDCEDECRSCSDAGFDCSDPACEDKSYCDSVENNCCDGFDNDDDGLIDCDDPECQGQPGCPLNGGIGTLGFNTKAFQNFQATQQTVKGALYIDFKRRIPEDFENKITQSLKNIKLYQPFNPLNIDTFRIDFDTDIYTEKSIKNYVEKTFSKDKPTTFNVPNFKVSNFVSNDTLVDEQRYLSYIKLQDFQSCKETKKKTKIAIVDNGFDITHEDLETSNIQGYDIADNDEDISIPRAFNERNHGTIARGIVNAVTNNNKGIAGIVNNNSELILIKATNDDKRGTDVTAGIEGLIKAADMGADIINISRGTFQEIPLLEKVVKQLKKKGVIMVASAGNYSSSTPFYPAAYDEVIAVGAHDKNGEIASFSNTGKRVDIYAPGTDITTTNIRNNYISIDGTSEAAPIVAATLALAKSNNIKTDAIFEKNGDYKILNTENICSTENLKNDEKARNNIQPLLTITMIIAMIGIYVFKNTLSSKSNDEK